MTQPELFYIPYDRFLADVEALARKLEADSWRADFLVGIGRGGLVPAAYLSHRLDVPLLSVDHSSGDASFAGELLAKLAAKSRAGTHILIIDDINDTGSTIAYLRQAIEGQSGGGERLRVGVLINNVRSKAKVDYSSTRSIATRTRGGSSSRGKRWPALPRCARRRSRCRSGSVEEPQTQKKPPEGGFLVGCGSRI